MVEAPTEMTRSPTLGKVTAPASLSGKLAEYFNQGDFVALGSLFAAEAVLLPPGGDAIVGASNIRLFWGRSRRIERLRFEPSSVRVVGEEVAREVGILHLRVIGNGPRAGERIVKYVAVYQLIEDAWKFDALMWNSSGEPAGALKNGQRLPGNVRGAVPRQAGEFRQGSAPREFGGGDHGRGPSGPEARWGGGRRQQGYENDDLDRGPFVPRIDK